MINLNVVIIYHRIYYIKNTLQVHLLHVYFLNSMVSSLRQEYFLN